MTDEREIMDPDMSGPPVRLAANGGRPLDELAERRRAREASARGRIGPTSPPILRVASNSTQAPPRAAPVTGRPSTSWTNPPSGELPPLAAFDQMSEPGDSIETRVEGGDPWLFVRRGDGKLVGAFTARRIEAMLEGGRLDDGASVSFDRQAWTPVADLSELLSKSVPTSLPEPPLASGITPPKRTKRRSVGATQVGPVPSSQPSAFDTGPPEPDTLVAAKPEDLDGSAASFSDESSAAVRGGALLVEDGSTDVVPLGPPKSRGLLFVVIAGLAFAAVWLVMDRIGGEPVPTATSTAPAAMVSAKVEPTPPAVVPEVEVAVPEAEIAAATPPAPTVTPPAPTAAAGELVEPVEAAAAAEPAPADPPVEAPDAPAEAAVAAQPAARPSRGYVQIASGRSLSVKVDGRIRARSTPARVALTAGRHRVDLIDADGEVLVTRWVKVNGGRTARLDVSSVVTAIDEVRESARVADSPKAAESPTAVAAAEPAEAESPEGEEPVAEEPTEAAPAEEPIAAAQAAPAAEPAPVVRQRGYVSVSSSRPLKVYIDGKATGKSTPLWMYEVESGSRLIELRSASGEVVSSKRTNVPARQTVPVLFKQ